MKRVTGKTTKAWYGVRTLYRIEAQGEPKSTDRHYDSEATLVEDRVVLFHAKNAKDAHAQASKEARSYCKKRIINQYGQKVVIRFLKVSDAYEMFDLRPVAGAEIFSSSELVRAKVLDSTIVTRKLGSETSVGRGKRIKFIDGDVAQKMFAIMAASKKL